MNSKFTMLGLVGLGLVAAFCAALLMGSLRADRTTVRQADSPRDVTIVLAKRDLPAMAIVKASDVEQIVLPAAEAPPGHVSHPTQAIGKPLALPVVAGQPLTRSCFAGEGTGAQMANFLPPGKRAVSVELSRSSGMLGLLYPGCVVDVNGSFRLPPSIGQTEAQAVSTTLVQGVQVLAVENQTVFSTEDDDSSARVASSKKPLVTLMVDAVQARALQLAMEHGTISLSLRNPTDDTVASGDATTLHGGQMRGGGSMLDSLGLPRDSESAGYMNRNQATSRGEVPYWTTTVIRGVTFDSQTFSRPKEGDDTNSR